MNYYEDLFKKIETLFTNKDNEEALILINDEINMPYVPIKVMDKLYEYRNTTELNLKIESNEKIKNHNMVHLKALLVDLKWFSAYKFLLFNFNFSSEKSFTLLKKLSLNTECPLYIKHLLIERLAYKRMDEKVFIKNTQDDSKYEIDIKTFLPIIELNFYSFLFSKHEEIKGETNQKIFCDVLLFFCYQTYPKNVSPIFWNYYFTFFNKILFGVNKNKTNYKADINLYNKTNKKEQLHFIENQIKTVIKFYGKE